jgi:hypothetical protein
VGAGKYATCFLDVFNWYHDTYANTVKNITDNYVSAFPSTNKVLMINHAVMSGMSAYILDDVGNYAKNRGIYLQYNGGQQSIDSGANSVSMKVMRAWASQTRYGFETTSSLTTKNFWTTTQKCLINNCNYISYYANQYAGGFTGGTDNASALIDGVAKVPIYNANVTINIAYLSLLNTSYKIHADNANSIADGGSRYTETNGNIAYILVDSVGITNISQINKYPFLIVDRYPIYDNSTRAALLDYVYNHSGTIITSLGSFFANDTTYWGYDPSVAGVWGNYMWTDFNTMTNNNFTSNVNTWMYTNASEVRYDLTKSASLNISKYQQWWNRTSGTRNFRGSTKPIGVDYFGNVTSGYGNTADFLGFNVTYGSGQLIYMTFLEPELPQFGNVVRSIVETRGYTAYTNTTTNFNRAGLNFTSDENTTFWENGTYRYALMYSNGSFSRTINFSTPSDIYDPNTHQVWIGLNNLSITTNNNFRVIRSFNAGTFNVTQGASSTILYDSRGVIFDSGIHVQITLATLTSIKWNSTQNYTNTHWIIVLHGDYTGRSYKYLGHFETSWITIPAANITFNGTDTIFDLWGINVGASANSNELREFDAPNINSYYLSGAEFVQGQTISIFANVTDSNISSVSFTLKYPAGTQQNYTMALLNGSSVEGFWNYTISTDVCAADSFTIPYIYATDSAGNVQANATTLSFQIKCPYQVASSTSGGTTTTTNTSNATGNQSINNSILNTTLPQNITIKGGIQNITKPMILVNPDKIIMDVARDTWIKATVELKNVDNTIHSLTLSSSNAYFMYSEIYDIPMSTITLAPNETKSIIVSVYVKTNDPIVFNVLENNVAVGRFYIYPTVKDGLASDLLSKVSRKLSYSLELSKDGVFSSNGNSAKYTSRINLTIPYFGSLLFAAFIGILSIIIRLLFSTLYDTHKTTYIGVVLTIAALVLMV